VSEKADIVDRLYITPHFITADEFGSPYTMPHEITQRNKEERYEAAREIIRLRKERDAVRRELCFEQSMTTNLTMEQIAETRGWDCFEKQKREEAMDRLAKSKFHEENGLQ
jgi:hypothetical protein